MQERRGTWPLGLFFGVGEPAAGKRRKTVDLEPPRRHAPAFEPFGFSGARVGHVLRVAARERHKRVVEAVPVFESTSEKTAVVMPVPKPSITTAAAR